MDTGEGSSPLWSSVSQSVVWGDVLQCPFPSGAPGFLTAPQLPATKPGAQSCREFGSHGMEHADHFPAGPASPRLPLCPAKRKPERPNAFIKGATRGKLGGSEASGSKSKASFEGTLCEAKEHSMVLATV